MASEDSNRIITKKKKFKLLYINTKPKSGRLRREYKLDIKTKQIKKCTDFSIPIHTFFPFFY